MVVMVEIVYYEVQKRKKCSFLDFPKRRNNLKDSNMEPSSYFARQNLGVNHWHSLKGVCMLWKGVWCKATHSTPEGTIPLILHLRALAGFLAS